MEIKKRDNTKELFDINKIFNAMSKAFAEEKLELPEEVKEHFKKKYDAVDENLSVEDVQDHIEKYLMKYYPCVAKKFIIYRYEHKLIRESKDKLITEVSKKLMASNVENQNANVDEYSFGGRIGEASSVVTKDYALKYCMSRKSRNNHLNNEIYIHDLDSYAVGSANCLSVPVDKLFKNGFKLRQCDIRPAKSINTALQLLAVIFQVQSQEQFGGVSATHLDWSLVPYVRMSFRKHYLDGLKYLKGIEDKTFADDLSIEAPEYKEDEEVYNYAFDLTKKELDQSVEGMYHNLNTLQSRSGKFDSFS